MSLLAEWVRLKELEDETYKKRIEIEEKIQSEFFEGTKKIDDGDYKATITGKMNITLDRDKIIEIAEDHGLTGKLENLFRWKPEIDKKNWDMEDDRIKAYFVPAITKKPAKLSFKIEKIKE